MANKLFKKYYPSSLTPFTITKGTTMSAINYLSEYLSFHKWFQETYPALCRLYCDQILPPINDSGVVVNRRNLDTDEYQMLIVIIGEYYRAIKK